MHIFNRLAVLFNYLYFIYNSLCICDSFC